MYESTKASTNHKTGEHANGYNQSPLQPGLEKMMQVLEGPGVMRALSLGAGAALAAGTTLDLLSQEHAHFISNAPAMVLRCYVIVFGVTIVLNELKSVDNPKLAEWRELAFKWMPFLSVTCGKGLFMILTSSVGLAFSSRTCVWAPSAAVFLVGVIYVCFYLYDRKQQDTAINASMSYTPIAGGGMSSPWV